MINNNNCSAIIKSSWLFLIASVFILFCITPTFLLAKEDAKTLPQKVELDPVVRYYYFDSELKKIDPANSTQQNEIIFNNSSFAGGYYSAATPSERVQDWGTSPGGTVMGLQFGVATSAAEFDVTIIIYEGTTDSDTGSVLSVFPLSGFEGSDDGTLVGLSYDITLSPEDYFELPEGPLGYAYITADDDGPLTATGGEGTTEFFRTLPDTTIYTFTSGSAQFWMKLTGDSNEEVVLPDPPSNDECATATVVNTFPFTDSLDTRGATNNPADRTFSCNDGGLGGKTDGRTVWYVWSPDVTRTVNVSTDGSDYDTVHGIYRGDCEFLRELECVDIGIADDLVFEAIAGQTYYIKVGEFLDGAGAGNLVFSIKEPPTLYQGPSSGSISSGAAVTTDNFSADAKITPGIFSRRGDKNTIKPKMSLRKQPIIQPTGKVGSNFVPDLSVYNKNTGSNLINAPAFGKGFAGFDDNGFIPPDPTLAVGPDHIVALINVEMAIYDKTTNERLKSINIDDWYSNVFENTDICDPQIIYDHFEERWVMSWIQCDSENFLLYLSASDDSNPLGNWCNWAIPGDVNGDSEPQGFFNDFPKMGMDDKAYYVMTNLFDDGYMHDQIRIIGKQQLYQSDCGAVTWTDIWDLRDPNDFSQAYTVVPYLAFENTSEAYFAQVDFAAVGTFINLWTLTDPLGTPAFTVDPIPVTAFTQPGATRQRKGGETAIDNGGSRIRQAIPYRDGDLWLTHSVGDDSSKFARVSYKRIDVASKTAEEDVAFGADGFWYIYSAIAVDENKNVFLAFTRTGENEYASARYTGHKDTDSAGLQTSALLKGGEANYVKTYGGTRNRWGDYSGLVVDPTDGSKVWMHLEYAEAPSSTWGTWIGSASFNAEAGAQIVFDPDSIDFNAIAVGDTSLPVTVTVQNSGQDDLTITSIALASNESEFELQSLPVLPLTLSSFQGFEFSVVFTSANDMRATNEIIISSNDTDDAVVSIPLVKKTPPQVALAQTSFDVTADSAQTTSFSFTINNTGGDDLEYGIGFTGFAEFTPPASSASIENQMTPNKKHQDVSMLSEAAKANLDLKKTYEPSSVSQAASANTLFLYDVSTPAEEVYAFAVDFDGTNILVAGGGKNDDASDGNRLLVYDINGNLVQEYDQGNSENSVIGWRDMAVNGTLLYGMDQETAQIDEFDLETGMLTGVTIASPRPDINLRAIAYDPDTDHFWLSGLGLNIYEIDRQSNIVREFNNVNALDIRGLGWDNVTPEGPYLWVWADGEESTQALLFDPVAGKFTDIRFDGESLGNNIAGGAMFTTDLPTNPANTPVFLALHQNTPDDWVGAYVVPPTWLAGATPEKGKIASGSNENVDVTVDVFGYDFGQYKAGVVVGTNDLNQPVSVIEVNLTNDFGTSVASGSVIPDAYALEQNYPNPFNPETKIRYTIPEQNHVSVVVYNVLGQKVRTLVDEVQIANTHEISWDGRADNGNLQSTGIYIIKLRAGNFGETIKLMFVK